MVTWTHYWAILIFHCHTSTGIPEIVWINSTPIYGQIYNYSTKTYWLSTSTYLKSAKTHSVLLLVILGGKSKNMVTFSVRLLVRQSVQLRMDEINWRDFFNSTFGKVLFRLLKSIIIACMHGRLLFDKCLIHETNMASVYLLWWSCYAWPAKVHDILLW